ncbi:triose-phosphate isomerase [Dinghuibacter silviterrae]|uniref:Triosephosphate isomerase n=1 Tax=Dinghuibacter silviterrae TaxID=1539049 RepID=A0A4R8DXI3_9BACT|nr:triose-phosphate isomerase [Dinghuibacter silviterrae]TDX02255.1 triosephosphate isomerase [Dinghuibacter silviterrae]
MRKQIAAANWKMNLTLGQAEKLLDEVLAIDWTPKAHQEVVFAVPAPYLYPALTKLRATGRTQVHISSQNAYSEKSGAYTGETSAEMLQSIGVTHVILGHSERREYFGETDHVLAKKLDIALAHGLTPIFCCGEPLTVREAGTQNAFVAKQIEHSLFHLDDAQLRKVVIAYEPIWAIGTGKTATSAQAQEMHAFLRSVLAKKYGATADHISILYGGSVKAANAAEIFACPDVDGGLVGGASLIAKEFEAIIRALK